MEPKYEYIGRGESGGHTYEVAITWSGEIYPKLSPRPVTIVMIDLSGTSSFGSIVDDIPLSFLRDEKWTEQLRLTGCLWLRGLAQAEQASGRIFTPDEISAAWHAHTG